MKVKAIIDGQTLRVQEVIAWTDGMEIKIEIPDAFSQNNCPSWDKLQSCIGAWKDDSDIDEIFDEIDKQRHSDFGREINFYSNTS